MTRVNLDYYNTFMYYVGMLDYHVANSYFLKLEDFCDAYPEEVDVFGLTRDLVFFLQVRLHHNRTREPYIFQFFL